MSLISGPVAINQPNPFEQLVHLLKARVADFQQQADSNPDLNPDLQRLPSANEIRTSLPSPASDLNSASLPGPARKPENQTPQPTPDTSSETVSPQPAEAVEPSHPSVGATQSPQYVLPENPAVEYCIAAWDEVWNDPKLEPLSEYDHRRRAGWAYRDVMPPPVGRENIRDFVACVTKGMLIGAIPYNEGPKLLYAAQIAQSACEPRQPLRQPGRPHAQPSEATAPPAS